MRRCSWTKILRFKESFGWNFSSGFPHRYNCLLKINLRMHSWNYLERNAARKFNNYEMPLALTALRPVALYNLFFLLRAGNYIVYIFILTKVICTCNLFLLNIEKYLFFEFSYILYIIVTNRHLSFKIENDIEILWVNRYT